MWRTNWFDSHSRWLWMKHKTATTTSNHTRTIKTMPINTTLHAIHNSNGKCPIGVNVITCVMVNNIEQPFVYKSTMDEVFHRIIVAIPNRMMNIKLVMLAALLSEFFFHDWFNRDSLLHIKNEFLFPVQVGDSTGTMFGRMRRWCATAVIHMHSNIPTNTASYSGRRRPLSI